MNLFGDIICKGVNLKPLDSYDLFVTSAGFEDRTSSGLELVINSTTFKRSIITLFRPDDIELFERNRFHLEKMQKLLTKISDDCLVVEHKPNDPDPFTQTLYDDLKKYR